MYRMSDAKTAAPQKHSIDGRLVEAKIAETKENMQRHPRSHEHEAPADPKIAKIFLGGISGESTEGVFLPMILTLTLTLTPTLTLMLP